MGKRYYCDYCDKSFSDNPTNRKNHMFGVQHRSAHSFHYSAFQDPEIILAEDSKKNSCRQFLQTGECKFGSICKFSHLTPADKDQLLASVNARNQKARDANKSKLLDERLVLETWLTQWSHKRQLTNVHQKDNTSAATSTTPATSTTSFRDYQLPTSLTNVDKLPPSLRPPVASSFSQSYLEWG